METGSNISVEDVLDLCKKAEAGIKRCIQRQWEKYIKIFREDKIRKHWWQFWKYSEKFSSGGLISDDYIKNWYLQDAAKSMFGIGYKKFMHPEGFYETIDTLRWLANYSGDGQVRVSAEDMKMLSNWSVDADSQKQSPAAVAPKKQSLHRSIDDE